MDAALQERIRGITHQAVAHATPLGGGCIGAVYYVELADKTPVVIKAGRKGDGLDIEGRMLGYLKEHSELPVPGVIFAGDDLLVMDFIESGGGLNASAEAHAADLLAALHGIRHKDGRYGLHFDTLIGGLHQPNDLNRDWTDFFRDQRLMHMARMGLDAGRLPGDVMGRIERLCAKLEDLIGAPGPPSLIHGDMWGGNVLCSDGRIAGFIDPAIYYADAEIELAFSTLFGTFGDAFFTRYQEHRPIRDGFFEHRKNLYNLYPLLVHVRLFGGHYVGSVEQILRKFGV